MHSIHMFVYILGDILTFNLFYGKVFNQLQQSLWFCSRPRDLVFHILKMDFNFLNTRSTVLRGTWIVNGTLTIHSKTPNWQIDIAASTRKQNRGWICLGKIIELLIHLCQRPRVGEYLCCTKKLKKSIVFNWIVF